MTPAAISLRAAGSCPCPIEIALIAFFFFRASSMIGAVGSAPCESSATIGVNALASSSTARRSSGRLSM